MTQKACGMEFRSGTSLTYKEVTYSASVSPQAIAHGSGDTELSLVHNPAAVHVSKDFLFLSWLPDQALVRGCSSSAL